MPNYAFLALNLPYGASEEKIAGILAHAFANSHLVSDKKLTKSEFYCLLLAAHGMTSLEASKVLGLSKDTIESHRKKIRHKLNCKNMAHAVFQAVRYELRVLSKAVF